MKKCLPGVKALAVVLSLLIVFSAPAQNIIYPSNAGVYNVKDYGAYGDGIHDDTKSIQDLLDAHPGSNTTFYFPNGIYLVSNTIKWAPSTTTSNCGNCWKRTVVQGQSRDGVIIQLKDASPGFTNPSSPKPVIWTGIAPAQRFRNGIRNITVNTGKNNPGACGIQYNTSNQGNCEYIKIVSGDGSGINGLDLQFTGEIGPGLIRHLTVEGFNYGVNANCLNSITLEDVNLSNQKVCGLKNANNMIAIRKLVSNNTVKAIENSGGYMVLMDAVLSAGTSGAAITNSGVLYARNVSRSGYVSLIDNTAGTKNGVAGNSTKEFCSHNGKSLFTTPPPNTMLNLPVKESPELAWDDTTQWANPEDYGANGSDQNDDTKAIQDAIDAGKKTVYFPGRKTFYINGTVYIRGSVKRITGCEGKIQGTGTIVFQNGTEPVVIVERFDALYSSVKLRHEASRTMVLKGITGGGIITGAGSGDFFLDDVCNGQFDFTNPAQHIWIRQINPESNTGVNVKNNGATLWILMFKTERGNVKLQTINGGKSEVLGVHNYAASAGPQAGDMTPYFDVDNSFFSVACYRETNFNNPPTIYNVYVRETQNGVTKTFLHSDATEGGVGNGKGIALYTSGILTTDIPPIEKNGIPSVSVFPNPAKDNFTIRYPLPVGGTVKISVYDILGKEVITGEYLHQKSGQYEITFNAETIQSGTYILNVSLNGERLAQKLLVIP